MHKLSTSISDSSINNTSLIRQVEPKTLKNEDIGEVAKAGLECVIDFRTASLGLKINEKDNKGLAIVRAEELNGRHDLRLIHVKGARRMQIRLVKPSAAYLNNNDSYILVTPTTIIQWNGRNSTIMKKAKASDLAENIKKWREYGCTCRFVRTLEHYGKTISPNFSKFFNEDKIDLSEIQGITDADYEASIIKTNIISEFQPSHDSFEYRFSVNKELSGKILRKKNLDTNKAYILDFGTEVYLWIGSKFNFIDKALLPAMAVEYFNKTEYNIDKDTDVEMKKLKCLGYTFSNEVPRPDWVTLEKLNEKCETLLFKKKFSEWSDLALPTRKSTINKSFKVKRNKIDIIGCLNEDLTINYILLGAIINRGQGGFDSDLEFNFTVIQNGYTVYRVIDNELKLSNDTSHCSFFSQEVYLVEWKIFYRRRDVKTLTGDDSSNEVSGREILTYFYWQGRDCTVSEKAMSAILTIFHVSKKAIQVSVTQDLEIPAFLSIFQNQYISCIGKCESFAQNEIHIFLIRGTLDSEQYLVEVEPKYESLRSQAHFLIVNQKEKKVYHWIGATAPKQIDPSIFFDSLKKLLNDSSFDSNIETVNERKEPESFKKCINFPSNSVLFGRNSSKIEFCCYFRRLNLIKIECCRISSIQFQIKNQDSKKVNFDKFPLVQNNLYGLIQPAIVLVCCGSSTYLWHGWNPVNNDSEEDIDQLAQNSVLKDQNFIELKNDVIEDAIPFLKSNHFSAEIVEIHAGFEPENFITLFPFWKTYKNIKTMQERLGRNDDAPLIITEINASNRILYSYEVLKIRPLPDGVNPTEIEMYLEDAEFENIFKCDKESYKKLPSWKRIQLKKANGLF